MAMYRAFALLFVTQAFGQTASEDALAKVAAIHGNAGVFAVAGYRMGESALQELGLPRGSFALEVVHHTPMEIQYSCIADGVQAATGASAGKLNLRLLRSSKEQMETEIRNRKTGQVLIFQLRPAFLRRYLNLPYEKQPAAAKEVLAVNTDQIFTVKKKVEK